MSPTWRPSGRSGSRSGWPAGMIAMTGWSRPWLPARQVSRSVRSSPWPRNQACGTNTGRPSSTKSRTGTTDASLVRTTLFSPTGFPFKVVQLRGTLSEPEVFESRDRVCDIGLLQQLGFSKPNEDGSRKLFQRCPASPIASYVNERGLQKNTEERRCLCNGLLACAGLGQARGPSGAAAEEPAIVTLGSHLDGIRRLSRRGQAPYWVKDVVADILG